MSANIPQYLIAARFAQIAYAEREANELALKGSFTTPQYSLILSVTRQAIEARYNKLPNDPSLQATAEFMYALSGGAGTTPTTVLTPFFIVTQPISQTVNSGANVTFNVIVTGGVQPYTYQWQKFGFDLPGETNQTLNLTNVTSGNAGTYDVKITDARGVVLTSTNALLLVVTPPITANWYWSADTDPYPQLSIGIDNLTYLGSVTFSHLAPIIIPWPSASADNTYKVVRYPIGEGAKVNWNNTTLNNGPIPGTAYHEIVTIGSFLYIISRGDSIFTPYTVTYT